MKICDLLKVHKNQVLVVSNQSRDLVFDFLVRFVDRFDVPVHDGLQILAELFFRLDQLTDDSPGIESNGIRINGEKNNFSFDFILSDEYRFS